MSYEKQYQGGFCVLCKKLSQFFIAFGRTPVVS